MFSPVPALFDALVNLWTDALPDWRVVDGLDMSSDLTDVLMVGVPNPDTNLAPQAATETQEWATLGSPARARDSAGEIVCCAYSLDGGGDPKVVRDRVYQAAEKAAEALRVDPHVGISGVLWTNFGAGMELYPSQTPSGADALLVWRVQYRARV